jgi:hypothetical protein
MWDSKFIANLWLKVKGYVENKNKMNEENGAILDTEMTSMLLPTEGLLGMGMDCKFSIVLFISLNWYSLPLFRWPDKDGDLIDQASSKAKELLKQLSKADKGFTYKVALDGGGVDHHPSEHERRRENDHAGKSNTDKLNYKDRMAICQDFIEAIDKHKLASECLGMVVKIFKPNIWFYKTFTSTH